MSAKGQQRTYTTPLNFVCYAGWGSNLLRCLTNLFKFCAVEHWSLTTLREKLRWGAGPPIFRNFPVLSHVNFATVESARLRALSTADTGLMAFSRNGGENLETAR